MIGYVNAFTSRASAPCKSKFILILCKDACFYRGHLLGTWRTSSLGLFFSKKASSVNQNRSLATKTTALKTTPPLPTMDVPESILQTGALITQDGFVTPSEEASIQSCTSV